MCLLQIGEQATARQQGQAAAFGQFTRAMLETEVAHLCWRGPDEDDARRRAGRGEAGVLRQEAIPGMYGLRAAAPRHFQYGLLAQVALRCRCRADAISLVCQPYMRGLRV